MVCEVPDIIKELVEDFKNNEKFYKDSNLFDEENTKIKFINPFFEALGWDIRNNNKNAPQYQEVVFEESIKVGSSTKAPDYSFKLYGQRVFFVEAKKPSVKIESDKSTAYQIRRYGWSANLPVCILTDFEHFIVYDTTKKPNKNEDASIERFMKIHYTEYVDRWDEIASLFHKKSILQGSLINLNHNQIKKGTSKVNDEFLKEMEEWRLILAKNIALRNSNLNIDELNYAVQLIIDRIIFLRIAEDRGIEKYGQLEKLLEKPNIYENFCKICIKADELYNSGLFHFTEENDNDFTVDNYTLKLFIDDKTFKEIISNLYYPNCPFEFSVIPLEILGNVYEQFLGSIIRLTPGHQAKIEQKIETRKSGGVYYTPSNVTRYIVKNTLGKIIDRKTPNEISKIKIADISCGSGSFLLEAYNYLLQYHLDYYTKLEKPPKNVIFKYKDGFHLTIKEKKRILLNNIYGVDIDNLAVEVTKLSLLLKVLEHQNRDELEQQTKLFNERVLPDLKDNIKCGNSLVNLDVYNMVKEVNGNLKSPFNYDEEFKNIMNQGGFDVIIGNPPYVKQQSITDMKNYLKSHFKTYTGRSDKYVYFIEKGSSLLKNNGYLGYICSNKYTRTEYGEKVREKLSKDVTIKEYYECDSQVFKATVDTSIIIIQNKKPNNNKIKINNGEYYLPQNYLNKEAWVIKPPKVQELKIKLLNTGKQIKDIPEIKIENGIKTGKNDVFLINEEIKNKLIKEDRKNAEIINPILRGKNINQYYVDFKNEYLLTTKNGINIKKEYPTIYNYLYEKDDYLIKKYKNLNKPYTSARNRSDKGKHWTNLRNCKYYKDFDKDKIIYAELVQEPHFYYDTEKYFIEASSFILISDTFNLKYLTALFNSNISFWIMKQISTVLGKSGIRYKNVFMDKFPIPKIDIETQERISQYTQDIQELYKKINIEKVPQKRKEIKQRIDMLKKDSNNEIYEIYNLNSEEIEIIENDLKLE